MNPSTDGIRELRERPVHEPENWRSRPEHCLSFIHPPLWIQWTSVHYSSTRGIIVLDLRLFARRTRPTPVAGRAARAGRGPPPRAVRVAGAARGPGGGGARDHPRRYHHHRRGWPRWFV